MSGESWLTGVRGSGILLHISSCPGKDAIGTIRDCYPVLDIMKDAGQTFWQRLPVNPTGYGDSPFQGPSRFAANPNLISLEDLVERGDLSKKNYNKYHEKWDQYKKEPNVWPSYAEYGFLWNNKLGFDIAPGNFSNSVLRRAYIGFKTNKDKLRHNLAEEFYADPLQNEWLDDYAIFMALKQKYGFDVPWNKWKDNDKYRKPGFVKDINPDEIEFQKYLQFVLDEQLTSLYMYQKKLGIKSIGDLPIYPGYDSAEVWQNPEFFQLDKLLNMIRVAAVPPDDFDPENGQLWGNPLYRWGDAGSRQDQEKVFEYFYYLFKRNFQYCDVKKRDHARGYTGFGSVSSSEKSAKTAKWIKGPGNAFLDYLNMRFGYKVPLLEEDLGVITPDVEMDLQLSNNPRMQVLLFVDTEDFKDNKPNNCPHRIENSTTNHVSYTGTHDNPPTLEEYHQYMNDSRKKQFRDYLRRHSNEKEIHWMAIDAISGSDAGLVISQMQDLLKLGKGSRMNYPGQPQGYWRWRMTNDDLIRFREYSAPKLLEITKSRKRIPHQIFEIMPYNFFESFKLTA